MRTGEEFTVGSHTYRVNMWHPDFALENFAWLTKLVGEPALAFIVSAKSLSDVMDSEIDKESMIITGLAKLLTSLDPKEFSDKVKAMLTVSQVLRDGKKLDYANDFMGGPGHLLQVAIKMIRVQYADFFDVIPGDLLQKAGNLGESSIPAQ